MLANIHLRKYAAIILMIGLSTTVEAQTWSLTQCIDTAMVHNRSLRMERNNMEISDERHKESKANLIPKVTANGEYKYFFNLPYQLMPMSLFGGADNVYKEVQFGVPHNLNANLQLTMPLYNPQVYGAIKTTRIASEMTELNYQRTEEQVYYEISNYYYNAQILLNQLAFMDSNLTNSKQLLKTMELLHQALLVKGTDVSKVQLQVDQLTTQRMLLRSKYNQVLNGLRFNMGIPLEQELEVDAAIVHGVKTEFTAKPTLDVQLAGVRKRLISSELKTLKMSRLPSVALYGTYGTTGFGYDEKPNDFFDFYPIGLAGIQISYPLFNGTVTMRKIRQKKLEVQNSELQLSMVTEKNKMETQNAIQQRDVTLGSISNTLSQVNNATSVYEQTLAQQKQGVANLSDVLMADNTLREAQQQHLSALIEYLKADLELKKATGNITTKH